MHKVGNDSERVARDAQELFGHIDNPQTLGEFLKNTYSSGSTKYRRYVAVADSIFPAHNGNVLELGGGVGDLSFFCMSRFPGNKYYISELSIKQLSEHASETATFFNVDASKAELVAIEAEHIPFPDGHFNAVIIKASVHHFEDPVASFNQIYRVLKPGGVVVFIEDPICLDIPVYRTITKKNFSLEERKMGINEHIYTIKDYLGFAPAFADKKYEVDPILVEDVEKYQSKRSGLKKIFFDLIIGNRSLLQAYIIRRFGSPIIFTFTK